VGAGAQISLARRYGVYAVVGAVVALLTIVAREVIAIMLPGDDPYYYGISIVCSYILGIILSFFGHRMFSFGDVTELFSGRVKVFVQFVGLALLGMATTFVLAMALRYLLPLDALLGEWAAGLAFATAVLAASLLTFGLNRKVTFRAAGSDLPGPRADS
jgi:putative flippase GtrA